MDENINKESSNEEFESEVIETSLSGVEKIEGGYILYDNSPYQIESIPEQDRNQEIDIDNDSLFID
jgi:hypothetical protein